MKIKVLGALGQGYISGEGGNEEQWGTISSAPHFGTFLKSAPPPLEFWGAPTLSFGAHHPPHLNFGVPPLEYTPARFSL